MKIYAKALLATLLCTGLSACYNIGDGNQSPQAINVENKLAVDNLVGYFPVFADSSSKGYFYIHNNSDTTINDVKIDVRDDFYNVISLNTTSCGDMAPHTECKVNFTAKELANRFQRSSANFIISYDGIERTNRLLTYANAAHLSDSGIFFNGADGAVKNQYNMYYLYAGSNGQNKIKLQNVNVANENSAIVTNHRDFNNLLGAHQVFGVELHSFNDEGNELQVEAVDQDNEQQPLVMKVPIMGGAIGATGGTVSNIPVTMSLNTTTLSFDPNYQFMVTYTNSSPTTAYSLAPSIIGATWSNSFLMTVTAPNGLKQTESMVLSYYAAGSTGADCSTGKINPSSTCAYYVNWGAAGSPAKSSGGWLYDVQGGTAYLSSPIGVSGVSPTLLVSPTMPIINPDLGLQGGAIALAESTTSTAMKYKYSFVGDVQNKRLVVNLTVSNVGSESLNKFTFTPFSESQMGTSFKTLLSNSESVAMRQTTCPTATNGIAALQPNKSCGVTIVYNLLAIPANTAFESGNDYIKVSASYARAVGTATVRSVSQFFIVSATNYALSYNAYTGVFLTKGESSIALLNSSQSNAGAYPSGFNLVQGMYFKTRYLLNNTTYGAAPKTVISAPSIVRTDGLVESTIATAFKFKFNKVQGNPTIDNSIPTSPTCELNTPGDICELEVINLWRYDQLGSKNASYTLHTRIDYVSPYFLTVPQIESFTFNSIAPAVRLMQTGHNYQQPFAIPEAGSDQTTAIGLPWNSGTQIASPYSPYPVGSTLQSLGLLTKRFTDVPGQPNCIYDNLTGLMWLKYHYSQGNTSYDITFPKPSSVANQVTGTSTPTAAILTYYFTDRALGRSGGPSNIDGASNSGIAVANSLNGNGIGSNQPLCGQTGWHLPTSLELQSLENYGVLNNGNAMQNALINWIESQGFKLKEDGCGGNWWCTSMSATSLGNFAKNFAVFTFGSIRNGGDGGQQDGSLVNLPIANTEPIMLVRQATENNIYASALGKLANTTLQPNTGNSVANNVNPSINIESFGVAWPQKRYLSDPSGKCAIDTLTGLIVPYDASFAGTHNNDISIQYTNLTSNNNGYCGRSDWRFANIIEVNSFIDTNSTANTPNNNITTSGYVKNFVNWGNGVMLSSTTYTNLSGGYSWGSSNNNGFGSDYGFSSPRNRSNWAIPVTGGY